MANDSVETWRLYSAEAATNTGAHLGSIDGARDLVERAQASAWWRWNVRSEVRVNVELAGHEAGGFNNSYSRPNDDPPTSWTLSLHPERLFEMEVLHELAHTIAPRWTYAGPTPEGHLPEHRELAHHGPEYAGMRIAVAREFARSGPLEQLLDNYEHFKVNVTSWEDVQAAMRSTQLAEDDLVRVRDSHPEGAVVLAMLRRHTNSTPADLGPTLAVARHFARLKNGRRPTQAWVAEQISTLIPCTARMVSKVENLNVSPTDERTYQVALCIAVLFNVDPVRAQWQLGLDRDEWDLPLADLAKLNQPWAALVEEMNDLIRTRPPRWYA